MSYPQLGYPTYTPTQFVSGSPASCCEGSSPEPASTENRIVCPGQSCRLTGSLQSSAGYYGSHGPYAGGQASAYIESPAFYPALGPSYGVKETSEPLRNLTHSSPYYYDPALAAYGYGDLDLSGPRRKAVTRDSTSTLKAWLNEHRKNPYPTKGEKIMLAIITKMTLTQVSTWFANARRRLKKENKMTWEPRTKAEMEDLEDRNDEKLSSPHPSTDSPSFQSSGSISLDVKPPSSYQIEKEKHMSHHLSSFSRNAEAGFSTSSSDMDTYMGSPDMAKPKIWSLADTATSKSPGPFQEAPGGGGGLSSIWYGYHHTDTPPQTPPNLKSQCYVQNSQFFYHTYSGSPTELKIPDTYRSPCGGDTF